MKKLFFLIILIGAFISSSLFVLADESHSLSLEDVLEEIMLSQSVKDKSEIDCEEITNEQFERLGEAVMGTIHPEEREHKLMDQMMGGEGSESLKAMHILMGKRYLGCLSGMIGSGMMGGGMMDGMTNRLSWSHSIYFWFNVITYILVWIFLATAVIALLFWILKQKK